jgi:hypothetical protein
MCDGGARDATAAFNEVAQDDLECSVLALELAIHFKKPMEQADALSNAFQEAGYEQVEELRVAPAWKLVQMLHASGMGEGAMSALGILVGTMDSPFKWESVAGEEARGGSKSAKGGRRSEVAEQRTTRRPDLEEYDLPASFDGVLPHSPNFPNILAKEVSNPLPSLSSCPCPQLFMCVCMRVYV